MIYRSAILAAVLAVPAAAATIEDPDSPRFGAGLRVLGMRDDVEVIRLDQYAHLDREPLYLARSPDREAVFREGEDLCLDKPEHGLFVACNRAERRALKPAWLEPIRAAGVTVWPTFLSPRTTAGGGWGSGGSTGGGGGWYPILPPTVLPPEPPPLIDPPGPAPIPLPASIWTLLLALLAVSGFRALRRADQP